MLPTQQLKPRVAFRRLVKVFGATRALDDVSFAIDGGQVLALLGANGAGKSTLIKTLAGFHRPDGGTIEVDGVEVSGAAPGVSFIHQDLALVESATVSENIALSRGFPRRMGLIDWNRVHAEAVAAMAVIGSGVPVTAKVGDLTRAEQAMVAIARAVAADCRLLVLDEPTASLHEAEARSLFRVVRELAHRGVSILYVTHHLGEVDELADRVAVMRDGRLVAEGDVDEFTRADLIRLIVGSDVRVADRKAEHISVGDELLRLDGVRLDHSTDSFDLVLRKGEIIGLAGLRGAGQDVLGRGLAGVAHLDAVACRVDGQPVPRTALRSLVGFASSRREAEGLAMTLTVRENMFLNPNLLGRGAFSGVAPTRERRSATALGEAVGLRPNAPDAVVAMLSGGNQQKVVLARWLSANRRVLVLEDPTMGIDIGARAEIYQLIRRAAADGLTVVVVSSDFEELVVLCCRVLVLSRGRPTAELTGAAVTEDALMHAASATSVAGG